MLRHSLPYVFGIVGLSCSGFGKMKDERLSAHTEHNAVIPIEPIGGGASSQP